MGWWRLLGVVRRLVVGAVLLLLGDGLLPDLCCIVWRYCLVTDFWCSVGGFWIFLFLMFFINSQVEFSWGSSTSFSSLDSHLLPWYTWRAILTWLFSRFASLESIGSRVLCAFCEPFVYCGLVPLFLPVFYKSNEFVFSIFNGVRIPVG